MTAVPYCLCRHARQVHLPVDGSLCRGLCHRHGHAATTHTGACSARCLCDAFSERAA